PAVLPGRRPRRRTQPLPADREPHRRGHRHGRRLDPADPAAVQPDPWRTLMMTLPSSSQLISVVRAEISSTLGGLSDDPAIVNCLAMIDTLLASIAVRCEHEISWMAAEIEDIHEVA